MLDLALPLEQWRPILKKGMQGEDVRALQRLLIDEGHDVGRKGADSDYGGQTQNAMVAWQRARGWRGVEVTGECGPSERSAIAIDMGPVEPTLRQFAYSWSDIKYNEARNWSRGVGPQGKIWIVLHCMQLDEASTTAERCAEYFAGQPAHSATTPGTSAHACIDDDSIVQCVPWDRIAWHAPGANQLGIGLEHAGWARQSKSQWLDAYGLRMLQRSSWLCSQLAERHKIPLRICDAKMLRELEPGITTHAFVTEAFKKGDHTDPGANFPLADYVELCRRWRV